MGFYHLLFVEDSPATQSETVRVVGSAVGAATLVRRLFVQARGQKYSSPTVLCRPRGDGRWEVATIHARWGRSRYQRALGTRLRDITASVFDDVPPATNAVICQTNHFLYAQQGDGHQFRLGDLYVAPDGECRSPVKASGQLAKDTKDTSDMPEPTLQEKFWDPGRPLIMGEVRGPEAFDWVELGPDNTGGGLLSSIMLSESSTTTELAAPSASPFPSSSPVPKLFIGRTRCGYTRTAAELLAEGEPVRIESPDTERASDSPATTAVTDGEASWRASPDSGPRPACAHLRRDEL